MGSYRTSTRASLLAWALLAWAGAGCLSEDLNVEQQTFACQSDADCLKGYRCVEAASQGAQVCAFCDHFVLEPEACDACFSGACCAEASACKQDASCARFLECAARCDADDRACRQSCFADVTDNTDAHAAIAAVVGCRDARCQGECGVGFEGFVCDAAAQAPQCALCGALPFEPAPCAACVAERCCELAQACADEEACREHLECELNCRAQGDGAVDACVVGCNVHLRDGVPASWSQLNACRYAECGESCQSGCGPTPLFVAEEKAEACEACLSDRCCAEVESCGQDASCLDKLACTHARPLFDETLACIDYPSLNPVQAFFGCRRSECAQDCGVGQYWACLDGINIKRTPSGPMALTFRLQDFTTTQTLPGAQVYVCSDFDSTCASPLRATCPDRATACEEEALTGDLFQVTDANGVVHLQLLKPVEGFQGHFEFIDPSADEERGQGHAPLRYFVHPPLTEPSLYLVSAPLSNSTLDIFGEIMGVWDRKQHGQVMVTLRDCLAARAVGASISVDRSEDVRLAYARGGIPVVEATETDRTGTALVLDVPPGPITITATTGEPARDFSVARIHVKAGYFHYVEMGPNLEGE